jgi:calcineurin-like phosphoesterase family protein
MTMNYWLISDTHFNHSKIEDWGGRSGNWQQKIWDGIAQIPKGDVLIHLGDICIGDDSAVHRTLVLHSPVDFKICSDKLKLILVRGNHDKKSMTWYIEHGWDFVCDQIGIEFHGVDILLSHRPMPPDTWRWRYNIHGHTHGNLHRSEEYISFYDAKNYHIDISPEVIGYQPIRLDTLMKKYKV